MFLLARVCQPRAAAAEGKPGKCGESADRERDASASVENVECLPWGKVGSGDLWSAASVSVSALKLFESELAWRFLIDSFVGRTSKRLRSRARADLIMRGVNRN